MIENKWSCPHEGYNNGKRYTQAFILLGKGHKDDLVCLASNAVYTEYMYTETKYSELWAR